MEFYSRFIFSDKSHLSWQSLIQKGNVGSGPTESQKLIPTQAMFILFDHEEAHLHAVRFIRDKVIFN